MLDSIPAIPASLDSIAKSVQGIPTALNTLAQAVEKLAQTFETLRQNKGARADDVLETLTTVVKEGFESLDLEIGTISTSLNTISMLLVQELRKQK